VGRGAGRGKGEISGGGGSLKKKNKAGDAGSSAGQTRARTAHGKGLREVGSRGSGGRVSRSAARSGRGSRDAWSQCGCDGEAAVGGGSGAREGHATGRCRPWDEVGVQGSAAPAAAAVHEGVLASWGAPMCRTVSALRFFFFSSRRRHTRLVSDWSSDVCSSD